MQNKGLGGSMVIWLSMEEAYINQTHGLLSIEGERFVATEWGGLERTTDQKHF